MKCAKVKRYDVKSQSQTVRELNCPMKAIQALYIYLPIYTYLSIYIYVYLFTKLHVAVDYCGTCMHHRTDDDDTLRLLDFSCIRSDKLVVVVVVVLFSTFDKLIFSIHLFQCKTSFYNFVQKWSIVVASILWRQKKIIVVSTWNVNGKVFFSSKKLIK